MQKNNNHKNGCYQLNDITINSATADVVKQGQKLNLKGKSYDLLLALVKAAPNLLTHSQIMEQVWKNTIVNDETIKQNISRIRNVLGESKDQANYIVSVRGKGYRCFGPVTKLSDKAEQRNLGQKRLTKLTISAIATIFFVIGLVIFYQANWSQRPSSDSPIRVAVLPFITLNADETDNYLADGLTEELISSLAGAANLRVLARTTTMQYRHSKLSVAAIAEQLEVDAIVEGSIRRLGDRIRVYVQLIDGKTQEHYWSMEFNRPFKDIFSIRSQVINRIAESLDADIARSSNLPAPTSNMAAYDDYLKGVSNYMEFTDESHSAAVTFFKRAISRDPNYAEAWGWLANAYAMKSKHELDNLYAKLALETADETLERWPESKFALKAQGIAYMSLGQTQKTRRSMENTLKLKPNYLAAYYNLAQTYVSTGEYALAAQTYKTVFNKFGKRMYYQHLAIALARYARMLAVLGFTENTNEVINKAIEIEPAHPAVIEEQNIILVNGGNLQEALSQSESYIELHRDCVDCLIMAANNNYQLNNLERALDLFKMASVRSNESDLRAKMRLAQIYTLKNELETASQLIDEIETSQLAFIEAKHIDWIHYRDLGTIAVLRKDNQAAFQWFGQAIKYGFNNLLWFESDLALTPFTSSVLWPILKEQIQRKLDLQRKYVVSHQLNRVDNN